MTISPDQGQPIVAQPCPAVQLRWYAEYMSCWSLCSTRDKKLGTKLPVFHWFGFTYEFSLAVLNPRRDTRVSRGPFFLSVHVKTQISPYQQKYILKKKHQVFSTLTSCVFNSFQKSADNSKKNMCY